MRFIETIAEICALGHLLGPGSQLLESGQLRFDVIGAQVRRRDRAVTRYNEKL